VFHLLAIPLKVLTNVCSVGAHFIYASWYKKSELGTRAAVFVCFGHLGSMAGGWIQAGLVKYFASQSGLPAWRWIFIIISAFTIPTAIFGKLLRYYYLTNLAC
jgi:ACS family pantothenate transporter-like MFS transporter